MLGRSLRPGHAIAESVCIALTVTDALTLSNARTDAGANSESRPDSNAGTKPVAYVVADAGARAVARHRA